jgi:hypothetical protein
MQTNGPRAQDAAGSSIHTIIFAERPVNARVRVREGVWVVLLSVSEDKETVSHDGVLTGRRSS